MLTHSLRVGERFRERGRDYERCGLSGLDRVVIGK